MLYHIKISAQTLTANGIKQGLFIQTTRASAMLAAAQQLIHYDTSRLSRLLTPRDRALRIMPCETFKKLTEQFFLGFLTRAGGGG